MELTSEHRDLLAVVGELQTTDSFPGTKQAGQRLLEVWQQRGGAHSWHAYAPWHGTAPYASELHDAGLLDVHMGMARPHRWDRPADTVEQYGLSLTDLGRQALADAQRRN